MDPHPRYSVHDARDLYQAGYQIGREHGEWTGYRRGYSDGHHAGEEHARLTDDEFLDALALRIRHDDELREAIQAVMRATRTAITVEANRRTTTERGEAA